MAIPAFYSPVLTALKSAQDLGIKQATTLTSDVADLNAQVGKITADLSGVSSKVDDLSNELQVTSAKLASQIGDAIFIFDVFAARPKFLEDAGITHFKQLAKLDARARTTVFNKAKRSDAYPEDDEDKMTKEREL